MVKDYSKSLIYKLCCLDPNVTEIYIGSTTNFKQRKKNHKRTCNNSDIRGYNRNVYKYIRDNGGWINFEMVLIKNYSCDSLLELFKEEERIRKELKPTLNMVRAQSTKEEKKQQMSKNRIKWRLENPENYKEITIKNNKKNHTKWSEKVKCDCGCIVNRSSLIKHKKTIKHLALIN